MTFLKQSIFIIILLNLYSSSLTEHEIRPQKCTTQMNTGFIKFYEQNKIKYDFVIPTQELPSCYSKYIEHGKKKLAIIYTEIGLGTKGANCSLLLSRADPSLPYTIVEDVTMTDYNITCNKFILEEETDEDRRANRILSILSVTL